MKESPHLILETYQSPPADATETNLIIEALHQAGGRVLRPEDLPDYAGWMRGYQDNRGRFYIGRDPNDGALHSGGHFTHLSTMGTLYIDALTNVSKERFVGTQTLRLIAQYAIEQYDSVERLQLATRFGGYAHRFFTYHGFSDEEELSDAYVQMCADVRTIAE